jgi:hypothetical protein
MVQFWIVMGDVETPFWAVTLGTPVLVFAALVWVLRSLWKKGVARVMGRGVVESEEENSGGEDDDGKEGKEGWVSRASV